MYVLNYKKQIERINEMIPLRKNDKTFEVYYHDPISGKLWKSFFPRGTQSPDSPKLLRPEPLPSSLEHQLEICLNSGELADATGLGIEYSLNPERWAEILSLLDSNRKRYVRSGFFEFLNNLGVKHPKQTLSALEIDLKQNSITQKEVDQLRKKAKKLWIKKFFGV